MWKILSFFLTREVFIFVSFSIACTEKPEMEINSLKKQKPCYLIHTYSDKAFKNIVVNRTMPSLHGESLKITLSVPLNLKVK